MTRIRRIKPRIPLGRIFAEGWLRGCPAVWTSHFFRAMRLRQLNEAHRAAIRRKAGAA